MSNDKLRISNSGALEHSPLGPSAGERWLNCTASVLWTQGMPDSPSIYAAEGNFGHNISEYCRIKNVPAKEYIGFTQTIDGFTFTCDAAFADAIQEFLDYVNSFDCEPPGVFVESRVSYSGWVKYGFGTLDDGRICPGSAPEKNLIAVTDLKMGTGIKVYAENNTQLKLYGLGMYQELGWLYDIEGFMLNISQPRLEHLDEWWISTPDLLKWAEEEVVPAARAAVTGEGATFSAGKWCQFCPGKNICKHRAESMQKDYDEKAANTLTESDLGPIYGKLGGIRKWCDDVEQSCQQHVQAGAQLIGPDNLPLKMVEGRSNRVWEDAEEAEKTLRSTRKFKVSELFKKTLIGIPVAEKVLGKNNPVLTPLIKKPKGKPVLVLGSDPREPINNLADEIDDLEEEEQFIP